MLRILSELIKFRALLINLVSRELRVRYRGSLLGFLWTFFNPLLMMVVYALVFIYYIRIQMEDYTTFMIVGLLPWTWFATVLNDSSQSLISRMDLLTKVQFPPHILPNSVVFNHLINFLFSIPMSFIFILASGRPVGWSMLAFFPIVIVQLVLSMAIALLLSISSVYFRDIVHIIGNLTLLWFFATPIIYPFEQIPERMHITLYVNPVAPLIMAYQDIFYYGRWPNFQVLLAYFLLSVLFLIVASEIFNKYRDKFAEML